MSQWIRESEKPWWHKLCIRVLRSGPIPSHLAFIMDGNRRFAVKNSIERGEGHLKGFDKLAETLEWCLDLGISEVTVYAFSIENFKRSKEEVDGLMEIARQKFSKLMEEKQMIQKHGVCFRVLGNLELLPIDLQEMIAEAVMMTKQNDKAILNVCFAYTSRDEMCTAMREVTEGVQLGFIKESDISEHILEQCMYTNKSKNPDLLLRTSGEVRLSDFLLWQSSYSALSFVEVLWPEFSVWHLYAGILHYQRNYQAIQKARLQHEADLEKIQQDQDYQCSVTDSQQHSTLHPGLQNGISIQERVDRYTNDRLARIDSFLNHVDSKRENFLVNLLRNKVPS